MRKHLITPATSTRSRTLFAVPLLIGLIWIAPHAKAQPAQPMHRCRVEGTLVLQNGPCRGGQEEASASRPESRRIEIEMAATPRTFQETSQRGAPAKKKTLAEILRARDSNTTVEQPAEDPVDGAQVLRSRMGAV